MIRDDELAHACIPRIFYSIQIIYQECGGKQRISEIGIFKEVMVNLRATAFTFQANGFHSSLVSCRLLNPLLSYPLPWDALAPPYPSPEPWEGEILDQGAFAP
jgi:hypothetical protein